MADVAQDAPSSTRLSEAINSLRIQSVRARVNERTLMYIGGALGLVGLLIVLLGWWGAAHTINLPEQVPYVISGGLFGLGLVFVGGFCYFAYWMTRLVQEQQRQTAAMLEALAALRPTEAAPSGASAVASASVATGGLVATAKGTMAHRPDCSIVAGKKGLKKVTARDNLLPCKLCDPYGEG
jgi:hypothetical protein